jgi:uncharacterized membrane protein YbhN (UPF0104 family)
MSRLRYAQVPLILALFALFALRLDFGGLREALGATDAIPLIIVIALNLALCALFAMRMNLVLLRLGHRLPADVVLASAVVGNVAGALTPASSGEVLRAAALRSHSDVSVDDAVALITFERGMSLCVLALGTLAAFSTTVLPAPVAVAACAGCGLALGVPFLIAPLLDRLPFAADDSLVGRALNRVRSTAAQLRLLLRSVRLAVPWIGITATIFAVSALQFWILARSLDDVVTPQEAWIAFGASQLAAIVTFVPLGIGPGDASLAAMLRRYGMSLESGTAVAILVRATSTLPLIVLAALSYLYLSRRTQPERPGVPAAPRAAPSPTE